MLRPAVLRPHPSQSSCPAICCFHLELASPFKLSTFKAKAPLGLPFPETRTGAEILLPYSVLRSDLLCSQPLALDSREVAAFKLKC